MLVVDKGYIERMEEEFLNTWELSVRATHDFLAEEDIIKLRPFVIEGLLHMEHVLVIHHDQQLIGFLGVLGDKVEMLFVHPMYRHQGYGRELMRRAIEDYGIKYVDVNEQNHQAVLFYERLGFKVQSRSEYDEQGNPFPILHLVLA